MKHLYLAHMYINGRYVTAYYENLDTPALEWFWAIDLEFL
jgi:hypothetical protein